MPGTGHKQHLSLKILALLSLVRWYNILLTMLAQLLASVYVLNPDKPFYFVLADRKLLLIVLSTALIIAGGYIINSFYDIEKDTVNKPDKIIFNRFISARSCLITYLVFTGLGFFVALMASFKIFIFFIAFAGLLWLYSHKLDKFPMIREVSASLLTVTSFFSVALHFSYIDLPLFIYGSFFTMIVLIREIIKDFESMKGDAIFGYRTIVLSWPLQRVKNTIYLLILLTAIPSAWLFVLNILGSASWLFPASIAVLALVGWQVKKASTLTEFRLTNQVLKGMLVIFILAMIFFKNPV